MLKKTLITKLYSYNIHIGHLYSYNSQLNFYILGKRFNFSIININNSFLLLKKVIFFLKKLSLNSGRLLFHYTKYQNLNIIYKCVLLSISKSSNQQMITYNWKYGYIGNFFFSFFLLLKGLSSSWLKDNKYLFNFEKKTNIYYNYNVEKHSVSAFKYLFLAGHKYNNKKSKSFLKVYKSWYNEWIKKRYSYNLLKTKKSSLRRNTFLKKLCLNDINNIFKNKKMLSFKYLFLKLFYYVYFKKEDPFLLNLHSKKVNFLDYDFIHNKFLSYWRFLLFFKYFNNYYQLPDALFSVFPDNNDLPINEFTSSNLVSIGLVDTISSINNITYPIISNDDSLIVIIFYFTFFSNIFLENKLNIYNFLIKK